MRKKLFGEVRAAGMEIKRILSEAWSRLVERRRKLIKVLLLPILVLAIFGVVDQYQNHWVISFVLGAANIIIASTVAVATHRVILIGSDSIRNGFPIPDKRVLLFMIYSIILGLVLVVPIPLIAVFLPFGVFLSLVFMAYMIARFSLVFPAIAVDAAWSFCDSWNATKDYQFTMFVVVGLLPALLVPLDRLFFSGTFGVVIWSLASAIIFVYFVAVLSVSFGRLQERKDGAL